MTVEVRLFATLRKHLPPGSDRTSARLDVADNATITDLIEQLGIPQESPLMILVNGRYEGDRAKELFDGCTLSIFPPIAGG